MKKQLDLKGLGAYLAVAFGFTWLIDLVLFMSGQGVTGLWSLPLIVLSMWGPAVATFVVTRWVSPVPNVREATGLRLGVRGSKWLLYYIFALVAIPALVIAALFVGAAFGVFHMDLVNYSGYRHLLESATQGQSVKVNLDQLPIGVLVWAQIATLPIVSIVNVPATFGEEYGWRGYLLPALLPLGQWPALILHGVIWGLWHAPIILMGYNYPAHPVLGVLLMTVFTTLVGIIFGWTRLATGSVWPAVLAHAALNASAGSAALFAMQGTTVDTTSATILGWSGWIALLAVIAVLVLTKQLPMRNAADREAISGQSADDNRFERPTTC